MDRITEKDYEGYSVDSDYYSEYTHARLTGQVVDKLAEYENLEEQGMLLKLNAPIDIIIRCAMCTNIMRSDRGCDGGCQVDEIMFNRIMEEILKKQLK